MGLPTINYRKFKDNDSYNVAHVRGVAHHVLKSVNPPFYFDELRQIVLTFHNNFRNYYQGEL